MTKWFAVSLTVAATLFYRTASADPTDCLKDAQAFAAGRNGASYASMTFVVPPAPAVGVTLPRSCVGATCKIALLSTSKSAAITIPAGYSLDPRSGTLDKPIWAGVPRQEKSGCAELHMVTFVPAAATPAAAPAPAGTPTAQATPPLFAPLQDAKQQGDSSKLLAAHLDSFATVRQTGVTQPAIGMSQGLDGAVAETLQIFGQIVVDRASAEAYRLVKNKLEDLLGCGKAVPLSGVNTSNANAPPWPAPTFPATCRVLVPLRMQDIATSSNVLLGALAQDGVAYLRTLQGLLSDSEKKAEEIGVAGVVASVVVPLISRPQLLADNAQARAILGAIDSYVESAVARDGTFKSEAQRAVAAGAVAYTRCVYEVSRTQGGNLANCPATTYADAYAGSNVNTKTAARALAAELIAASTANSSTGAPDLRQRVTHAADALFASSCMLLAKPAASSDEIYPLFKCPDPPDSIDIHTLTALQILSLLQPIVDGALEGDSNALVSALARAIELVTADLYQTTHKRAFLLLGSIVEYGATFAQTGVDAQQLHDQRTKILESLTKDMTDRTARDGDDVWSFGGSLRVVGGGRFGGTGPAMLGPLSLPLGIGFDHVATGGSAGIHLEFSPVDLGQYVAYDNTFTVKTPAVGDALAPSFSVAAGWGKSIPLVLGATAGYSPTFALSSSSNSKGSFNCGAFIGMYVPLIDMN